MINIVLFIGVAMIGFIYITLRIHAHRAYYLLPIFIVDGTGKGQTRLILKYDGASKVATFDRSWAEAPDASSSYVLLPKKEED